MPRRPLREVLTFLALLALIAVPLGLGTHQLTYRWNWSTAFESVVSRDGEGRSPLLLGLWLTIKVSLVAIAASLPIGIGTGLARVSSNRGLRWWAACYVEVVRNSPLLVQIFIAYYFVGTVLDRPMGGVLGQGWADHRAFLLGGFALAWFSGAYLGEIVRGGIESVERGQMEAARALGLSRVQAMVHVILPQALRRSLPAMAGQFISLIKDSSLLSVIGVIELVKSARDMIGWNFLSLETWFLVALLYLSVCWPLSLLVRILEKRLARAD